MSVLFVLLLVGVGGLKGTFSILKLFLKFEDLKVLALRFYCDQHFQIIYLLTKEVAKEL